MVCLCQNVLSLSVIRRTSLRFKDIDGKNNKFYKISINWVLAIVTLRILFLQIAENARFLARSDPNDKISVFRVTRHFSWLRGTSGRVAKMTRYH